MKCLAVFALLATACGPSPVLYLRVEAPLVVPEACDAFTALVTKPGGGTAFEQTYPLTAAQQFPLTLLLHSENDADLGVPLTVQASAMKSNALAKPWSTAQKTVTLNGAELTNVTIELCDCTP